jgi:rhodanese-related sulfurtransferase
MYNSISIDELLRLKNSNIIDIRSSSRYNLDHIMGAINIPFEQLLLYPDHYLNKYDTYYIYCEKGLQSQNICGILNNMGFRTISVMGGYSSYLLKR